MYSLTQVFKVIYNWSDVLQGERGGTRGNAGERRSPTIFAGTPFPLTKTKRGGTPFPLTRIKPRGTPFITALFLLWLYSFNSQVSPAKLEYLFINDEGHATCDHKYLFRHLKNSFLSPEILEFIQSKPKLELDSWHPFRSLLLIFVF